MNRAVRTLFVTAALGIATVVGVGSVASSAGAQELDLCALLGDPYCPPNASVADSTVVPGGTVDLHGAGFTPGELVDITLHSTPVDLGSFTADADGAINVTVAIPATVPVGTHTITMVGQTSGVTVETTIEVVAPTEATDGTGGGGLARTGSDTGPLMGIGVGLVAAGAVAAYAARRRHASQQA